ncbi:MAG: hypothetical protein QF793_04095 [Candidatus Peribacteraceae bacterium]|jgi:hypothetical protein|nr:hypothetical protein [Candidatus Peribacteraceae bacterium]|tara:strand:- start:737 stop:1048 length:312 start_codon:yes stop_codon:yes gene_type:complete
MTDVATGVALEETLTEILGKKPRPEQVDVARALIESEKIHDMPEIMKSGSAATSFEAGDFRLRMAHPHNHLRNRESDRCVFCRNDLTLITNGIAIEKLIEAVS